MPKTKKYGRAYNAYKQQKGVLKSGSSRFCENSRFLGTLF